MLNVTAEIGSQIEVTCVKGALGSVTVQERVNGCSTYLHTDSIDGVRAGDKCRATLVYRAKDRHLCLVRVDAVIVQGDGHSSMLEKTLHSIELSQFIGGSQQDVLASLRSRCRGDNADAEVLETILDVLESYGATPVQRGAPLEYGHYCIAASRLIEKLHADDVQAKVALYERAARSCSLHLAGRGWGQSFAAVAASLRGRFSPGTTATA